MTMLGMDIETARQLGAFLQKNSEDLERTRNEIQGSLGSVGWDGQDAADFRSLWEGQLSGQLAAAANALHEADLQIRKQADEQETASDQGLGDAVLSAAQAAADIISGLFKASPAGLAADAANDGLSFATGMFGAPEGALGERVDMMGFALAGIGGGASWFGQAASNAINWTSDGITAFKDGVVGFSNDLIERGRDTVPAAQRFADTVGKILTHPGEMVQPAKAASAGGLLLAQTYGIVHNFFTKSDAKIADPGIVKVGDAYVAHDAGPAPRDFRSLTKTTMDAYSADPDKPHVQVTVVRNPGSGPKYIVSIPGTQPDIGDLAKGWGGGPAANDWPANAETTAFNKSAFSEGASHAIDLAVELDRASHPGETGRPDVLLTGHSQGGLTAATLAADSDFRSRYNVNGVVAYAAPVETSAVPHDTPVLSVENDKDPVPRLDLGGKGSLHPTNLTTVNLPAVNNNPLQAFDNHKQGAYLDNVNNHMPAESQRQIDEWTSQNQGERFYQQDGGSSTTIRVPVNKTPSRHL